MKSDQDDGEVIQIELSRKEAEDLLAYTRTSVEGDDSYDEMRERLVSCVEKMEEALGK
jgi:hypothetical protein